MKARYKLAISAPTCFYYQVALFRQLAAHPRIDLMVYFCSDEALRARDVQEMYHTDEKRGDERWGLAGCIQHLAKLTKEERFLMGKMSQGRIKRWIQRDLAQSLDQYFDFIYSDRRTR